MAGIVVVDVVAWIAQYRKLQSDNWTIWMRSKKQTLFKMIFLNYSVYIVHCGIQACTYVYAYSRCLIRVLSIVHESFRYVCRCQMCLSCCCDFCIVSFVVLSYNSSFQCSSTFTLLIWQNRKQRRPQHQQPQQQQKHTHINIIKTNKRSNRNCILFLCIHKLPVVFCFVAHFVSIKTTNLNFKCIKMLLINQVVANSRVCVCAYGHCDVE